MLVLQRLRLYHAVLAALVLLAYLTGEVGIVHAWLGYGVAAVIAFRLVWATAGVPQLGLMRFYPQFQGLKLDNAITHPAISRTLMLAIATTAILTTVTGIAMDRGRALGLGGAAVATAQADDDRRQTPRARRERDRNGMLGEVHEAVANMILPIVALHVLYLLLYKRPLARFMLFLDKPQPAAFPAATAPGAHSSLTPRTRPF
jgi:cytochrome b